MAYTKTHNPWSASDLLSGYAFNHLETQYALAKADADAHNHDTRYYSKATADVTFFSTSYFTGFDSDKLDGSHLSDIVSSVMPLGAIMIWSGTDGTVPSGWHICDGGTYGDKASPDLRDRFVIGAGSTYAVNAAGGALTASITGSITVATHAITGDEMPLHQHGLKDNYENVGTCFTNVGASGPTGTLGYATRETGGFGSGGAHGHEGSTIMFNALAITPKYYALYYIMKYA
jgi:hypothetical protein